VDKDGFAIELGCVADPACRAGVFVKKFSAPMPHDELNKLSGSERSAALWIIEISDGFLIFSSDEAHHGQRSLSCAVIGDSWQCGYVALTCR